MPVIQAVLRSQLQSAAGGNVRAQRDILAMIRDIEQVRSIIGPFETGGTDDVVDTDDSDDADGDDNDADDADAIDGDASDVDDAADADRDDAGDDDEPAQQPADGIDTDGERRQDMGAGLRLNGATDSSPPPCGEGSGVGVEPGGIAVPLGTTPHPNPPPAETAYTRVSATELSDRNRQQPISIGGRESTRPNLTLMGATLVVAPVYAARVLNVGNRATTTVAPTSSDAPNPYQMAEADRRRQSCLQPAAVRCIIRPLMRTPRHERSLRWPIQRSRKP
jgi:hypothetical protein